MLTVSYRLCKPCRSPSSRLLTPWPFLLSLCLARIVPTPYRRPPVHQSTRFGRLDAIAVTTYFSLLDPRAPSRGEILSILFIPSKPAVDETRKLNGEYLRRTPCGGTPNVQYRSMERLILLQQHHIPGQLNRIRRLGSKNLHLKTRWSVRVGRVQSALASG